MATSSSSLCEEQKKPDDQPPDRLKMLYPAVNEDETPLIRQWSSKDKYNFIGLTQNNLRVHYKGVGKNHKDAASVRATQPIPASCGIYYFEVKIISKGRDGYMGIGLSVQGVNLNRLPGWDMQSYGYHGDDGHSFCSSGTGQPYGPTFTTGDVIGCCLNLIENTCFYTKNGVNLGIAFRDLPTNLYPTVGLQTPGEIVEANFGQSAFMFDIEDYMREWRKKTQETIERFPVTDNMGEWQAGLHRLVITYLVHYGYCATAESFARSTQQTLDQDLASIKNRQHIQRLVLAGRMGETIDRTRELYPGLLERQPQLLFMLKCRQFIEMVNGTDSAVRGGGTGAGVRSPKSQQSLRGSLSPQQHSSAGLLSSATRRTSSSSNSSSGHYSSTHAPTPQQHTSNTHSSHHNTQQSLQQHEPSSPHIMAYPSSSSSSKPSPPPTSGSGAHSPLHSEVEHMNSVNTALNGCSGTGGSGTLVAQSLGRSREGSRERGGAGDEDRMDTGEDGEELLADRSGSSVENGGCENGLSNGACERFTHLASRYTDMETDGPPPKRQFCGGSKVAVERMIQFGRELRAMCEQLKREYGASESNERALKEAASMLAYSDPWSSPVGYQLDPVQREPVCAALNSAILECHGLPRQPALELSVGQVSECVRLMSRSGVASCAFASVSDYLH